MLTRLAQEMREQSRWQPQQSGRLLRTVQRLLQNEFLSDDEQAARADHALRSLMDYAASNIPYYRELLKDRELDRAVSAVPPLVFGAYCELVVALELESYATLADCWKKSCQRVITLADLSLSISRTRVSMRQGPATCA